MEKKEIELLECALCGNKRAILLKVDIADIAFSALMSNGVCLKCIQKGDFEKEYILKHKKVIKEKLKEAKEQVEFHKEQLKNIEDVKKEEEKLLGMKRHKPCIAGTLFG